jgi:hypothetical protein
VPTLAAGLKNYGFMGFFQQVKCQNPEHGSQKPHGLFEPPPPAGLKACFHCPHPPRLTTITDKCRNAILRRFVYVSLDE